MSDVQPLLARMAAQRESWVELTGGKRLQVRRPPELEMAELVGGVRIEHVTRHACGWAGFTEAVLLGPSQGSDTAVPFHADLWAAYAADHAEDAAKACEGLADAVGAYLKRRAETAKN